MTLQQNQGELKLKDQIINSLQAKIKEMEATMKDLSSKASGAEANVKDIAIKAIESSGSKVRFFEKEKKNEDDT